VTASDRVFLDRFDQCWELGLDQDQLGFEGEWEWGSQLFCVSQQHGEHPDRDPDHCRAGVYGDPIG